ncbi:MAG: response regulator receiver protein [Ignavibacteria bacterium]|nr:response regulator receiver protein [Ignavibacteria bacterium]
MKKPVIICVDDEKIVLDSLKKELNGAFKDMLSVEVAESAAEALEVLEELKADDVEVPIIISDWLMPEMKGDELLIRIHGTMPKTRKIMLTGQATTDGVGNAVNKAKLYRFIAKPWAAEDLDLTVTEAFKSYYKEKQIDNQEKQLKELNASLEAKVADRTKQLQESIDGTQELLNKTLKGSINMLINILSKSEPLIFEKGIRMRNLAKKILVNTDITNVWEIEIACLLSQIGCIDLPKSMIERYNRGEPLSQQELNMLKLHPKKAYEYLIQIPHLENVSNSISFHLDDQNTSDTITSILRIVSKYDLLKESGNSDKDIFTYFEKNELFYEKRYVKALIATTIVTSGYTGLTSSKLNIPLKNLKIGQVLAEDIKDNNGRAIFLKDEEITQNILVQLIQISKKNTIPESVYVYGEK